MELTNYLHILSIKLHWFYLHYYLNWEKFTCLALYTNFKVFIVSSMLFKDGEIFPTINVKVLPVNESCSNRVNLDYLKAATLLTLLERLAITFPKVVKD